MPPSFLVVALDCGWRGSGGGIVDRPSGTGSLIKAELFATLLPLWIVCHSSSSRLCFALCFQVRQMWTLQNKELLINSMIIYFFVLLKDWWARVEWGKWIKSCACKNLPACFALPCPACLTSMTELILSLRHHLFCCCSLPEDSYLVKMMRI